MARENMTSRRKFDHIILTLTENVEKSDMTTGLEDIEFVHNALPEVDFEETDVSIRFFGKRLSAPIVIASMTGGHPEAARINALLARVAEELNIAMGVGSQRAALEDPSLVYTYRVARDNAPNAFLIANIGAAEIIERPVEVAERVVEMIEADALAIHLNPLQEALQYEGKARFRGVLRAITRICENLDVPVIAKEVGFGIAREQAKLLKDAGVKGIDVGGAGGTNWARLETIRVRLLGDLERANIGKVFWKWGIPTAISTIEVAMEASDLTIIATGGVRTGLDAAKLLSLGADAVGIAYPLLKHAYEGNHDEVVRYLRRIMTEIRIVMFVTGSKKIEDLRRKNLIITGKTAEWLRLRGYDPSIFARRES